MILMPSMKKTSYSNVASACTTGMFKLMDSPSGAPDAPSSKDNIYDLPKHIDTMNNAVPTSTENFGRPTPHEFKDSKNTGYVLMFLMLPLPVLFRLCQTTTKHSTSSSTTVTMKTAFLMSAPSMPKNSPTSLMTSPLSTLKMPKNLSTK